jgi:hypothetical protein
LPDSVVEYDTVSIQITLEDYPWKPSAWWKPKD